MIIKALRVMRENPEKFLIQLTLVTNLILVVVLVGTIKLKTHYLKSSPYTSTTPIKIDLCHHVMNSILNKSVHPQMVTKQIKTALVESEYKALELKFDEKLMHVFDSTKGCKVILKDSLGLRAFDFILDESDLSPFYYKVAQITEHEIQGEE